MAKRNRQNRTLPVKAGMFSNYSQWWLSGGDLSQIAGAALLFSDTPYGRIQASLFNVWAANCISARAETLASVDLKLYRKSGDQDEDDEEIVEHPVLDLLEEVNPINLQKTSFREQIERQLSIHGDCYVHKVRGANGKPSEMYILPAQFVEPIPDAMRLVAGYRYQTSTVLSAQDIIRIYYPSDENPILARSPMTSAISAINNYSLSDLAQQGIDRRGGQGGGIVMVDFNTISGDPQRFMQEWDATRSDPRNAGRDAFLPTDSNYQSGTLTAQQQQREERATRLIREIMAALRVPPSLAGDYKDASVLANAAQQSKNFWETLMLFEIKRIEEALNIGLLWAEFKGSKEEGLYLKHDLTTVGALSEGEDVEVNRNQIKATTADTAFASGIISLNEARIYIGQEPIDDERADEVLQPEIAEEVGEAPLEDVELEEASEMDALLGESQAVKAIEDLLLEADDFLLETESDGESFLVEPVKAGKSTGGFDTAKQRRWYFAAKDEQKGDKSGGGGAQRKVDSDTRGAIPAEEREALVKQLVDESGTGNGFKVVIVNGKGVKVDFGTTVAEFDPVAKTLTFYDGAFQSREYLRGIVAHETTHIKEKNATSKRISAQYQDFAAKRTSKIDEVSPRSSPIVQELGKYQKYGTLQSAQLKNHDGVTPYSKSFWEKVTPQNMAGREGKYAISETLAEIAFLKSKTPNYKAAPIWEDFYRLVNKYGK